MSKSLTFLLDRDDLACLEALCPAALSGTIVAFDPDLHIELLSREVAHVTPWSFVGSAELDAVREFEQAVWEFWRANASAPFAGMDLLHMVSFRHRSCFSRIAWAAYVIRRVFEEVQPREVAVFEERTGHGLEQPPEHNKMPLLQALVRGAAEQGGVAVRLLRRKEVPGHGEFVDWTAKKSTVTLPKVDLEEALRGRPYVLMPGSGVDLLRPLPLARALHSDGELAVVQLYKSARPEVLKQAQDAGHFVWHESQVVGNAGPSAAATCFKGCRDRFDQARQRVSGHLRSIFANPYMNIHFDFIFGEYLAKMAWNVYAAKSFLERHPPHALVATSYSPLNDVACAVGIPCLGLPHGAMMVGNVRWFEGYRSSVIGALSTPHRQRLIEAGIGADRVVITGDPSLDATTPPEAVDPLAALRASQCRQRWGVDSNQRAVLLVMGNMGMLAKLGDLPVYDWSESVRCLRELGAMAPRHPDWRFVVRPHPRYDHAGLYELINRELPKQQHFIVDGADTLESAVRAVDVVVICNVLTSAILESSLWGKPVFVLSQSMIWYQAADWATGRWPHVRSIGELERELEEMFTKQNRYKERASQTRAAAKEYSRGAPARGIRACLDLIYSMKSRANAPCALAASAR